MLYIKYLFPFHSKQHILAGFDLTISLCLFATSACINEAGFFSISSEGQMPLVAFNVDSMANQP